MKKFICINCPMGCHLEVDDSDLNNVKVSGNTCPRGVTYAVSEVTAPKRMVTGTVKIKNAAIPVVSVKTKEPIPKQLIFESLKLLKDVELTAPAHIGDVAVENVCQTGIPFVVTKEVKSR